MSDIALGDREFRDDKGLRLHTVHTLSGAALLIFVFIFCAYLMWQNMFLAEAWWILPLRSIDDLAMQTSVNRFQVMLAAREWQSLFVFFDYAYGFGYWAATSSLLHPFTGNESPQWIIVAGRNLSLLLCVIAAFGVSTIGRNIYGRDDRRWQIVLFFAVVNPLTIINGTKLHVNAWTVVLSVFALQSLVKQKQTHRSPYLAMALYGTAVGFKLTSIVLSPIIIFLYLSGTHRRRTRDMVGHSVVFFVSVIAATAPAILWEPLASARRLAETFRLFAGLGASDATKPFVLSIEASSYFLHPVVAGLFVILTIVSARLTWGRDGTQAALLPTVVVITATFGLVALILVAPKGAIYLATYMQNVWILVPLCIYVIPKKFMTVPRVYAVIVSLCLLLQWNNQMFQLIRKEYDFATRSNSDATVGRLEAGIRMREIVRAPTAETIYVLQDARAVFPASNLDQGFVVNFNYGHLDQFLGVNPPYDYISLRVSGRPKDSQREISLREDLMFSGTFGEHEYEVVLAMSDYWLFVRTMKQ